MDWFPRHRSSLPTPSGLGDIGPHSRVTPTSGLARDIVARAAGRYEIVRPIGEGGMAQVFLCVHRGMGGFEKRVVMKVLREKFSGDASYIRMFLDEARLLSQMQHANIVDVFEVDCVDGVPYLLMAWVNGPTLGKLHQHALRSRLWDLGCFLDLTVQVCHALHYAHTLQIGGEPARIVHRDVSPQNILVAGDTGVVKLIDFGIAKTHRGQVDTEERIIKGKIPYMAPELLRGERADHRADLYALGVVLYRMITNHPLPPPGDDPRSARLTGQYPRASELSPDVSPELDAIIDCALASDPEERYASAADFAADLVDEMGRLGADPARTADWLRAVYPGGEDEWSHRSDDSSHAAITMHPSLARLVNRPPPPVEVPQRTGRTVALGGLVAAGCVLFGLGGLVGFALLALRLWTLRPDVPDPAPEPGSMAAAMGTPPVPDSAAASLAGAAELLGAGELDAARVMNRMAEDRANGDLEVLKEVARQRAEIDRRAAPGTPTRRGRGLVQAPQATGAPSVPPSAAPLASPPEEPEAPIPPAVPPVVEALAAVPGLPLPDAHEAALVGRLGGANRSGGHLQEDSPIKVFHQAELRVKTRSDFAYPDAARAANLGEHRCLVQVFIDERGVPYDAFVEGCPRAFVDDTRDTILGWRWEPPEDGGAPCKAQTTIAVNYRLGA